jgi:hypothetical protein
VNAVSNNPVTVTAAIGLLLQSVLAIAKASPEVQAQAAQITLAVAVMVRAAVAAWKARQKAASE